MAGTTTFYGVTYPTSTDLVKDGATAIETVATGFDTALAVPIYNAQTGTTYTFVAADTGKVVTASNGAATTYTIPPTASVAWTTNTTLRVLNLGAGIVTFAGGSGVTVTNSAQTLPQFKSASLVRTGLNAWTVLADANAASATMSVVAFVNFNGTGVVAIRASGNVSSITDHSTGNYTINFTTPLADANYAAASTGSTITTGGLLQFENSTARTSSAYRIRCVDANFNDIDTTFVNVLFVR